MNDDLQDGFLQSPDTWNAKAASSYDTDEAGMFAPAVLNPMVDMLEQLAAGGRVLEFAVGTGRVAIPLAERGLQVSGIDFSAAMIDELYKKTTPEVIKSVVGDMSQTRLPGQFSLVYLVFNTISNLLTQEAQVDCFRNAAAHLQPGGRFVIELGVPDLRLLPPGQKAVVFGSQPGYLGVDTYDMANQYLISHHFRFDDGQPVELGRSKHRYAWPAELDLMAKLAGMSLEARYADWHGSPFTSESRAHISIYRKDG